MSATWVMRLFACAIALGGVAARLDGFGRYGLSNDEARVALVTRVEGVRQFLLGLSVTPLGWGALVTLLSWGPGPPETALRLLPLAVGVATLWLAWRLGTRLADHPLGGLCALALVALDPAGIAWAQQLKPYTAEAALALATFLAAGAAARQTGVRQVVTLALVLALGLAFSNAQLFLAPPLFLALGLHAVLARDWTALRRLTLAGALVALWHLVWFTLLIHPWLTPALTEFWRGHYAPHGDTAALGTFAGASAATLLSPALGAFGTPLAAGGLVLLLATRAGRWPALAAALLVMELVALSAAGVFPLNVHRTALFATTLLLVTTGAAAGRLLADLWERPALRPVAVATGAALLMAIGWTRWPLAGMHGKPEDVGPLLQIVERDRRAGDRVLLYDRSVFVWGYYRTGTPILVPNAALANGYVVAVDDPDVVVFGSRDIGAAVEHALAGAARVWLVGSRFRSLDEPRIRAAAAQRGRITREERRERALLLRVERP